MTCTIKKQDENSVGLDEELNDLSYGISRQMVQLKFILSKIVLDFGWLKGFYSNGTPELTQKGIDAIKAYQINENYKRVDVI